MADPLKRSTEARKHWIGTLAHGDVVALLHDRNGSRGFGIVDRRDGFRVSGHTVTVGGIKAGSIRKSGASMGYHWDEYLAPATPEEAASYRAGVRERNRVAKIVSRFTNLATPLTLRAKIESLDESEAAALTAILDRLEKP